MGLRIRIEYRTEDGRSTAEVQFDKQEQNVLALAIGMTAAYATARWPGTGWMHSEHACREYGQAIQSGYIQHRILFDMDHPRSDINRRLTEELTKAASRLVGEDSAVFSLKNQDAETMLAAIHKPTDPTDGVDGKPTTMRHV